MQVKQFNDENLAHYSYAILIDSSLVVIDPSRNPQQYYDFARQNNATITHVIETHPHADFVSGHYEIYQTTGAKIYEHPLINPEFDFVPYNDGDVITIGNCTLKCLHTPGHSPDSISILLSENNNPLYLFSGDTLFVGDVGRPDLRENTPSSAATRVDLAKKMYHSIHDKLALLPDNVIVYPAHGAGSLCGKSLSTANHTTIGAEKLSNYAFQNISEDEFVNELLADQPYIPKYFTNSVEQNRKRIQPFRASVDAVKVYDRPVNIEKNVLIVDARQKEQYDKGHIQGAFNNPIAKKFETYLGTVVGPKEKFYLITETPADAHTLIERAARIGYEGNIIAALPNVAENLVTSSEFDLQEFLSHQSDYTILDVRNDSEWKAGKKFETAIHVPLNELRERINEIPKGKPILVHCEGGVRSVIGASIVAAARGEKEVVDFGTDIKKFKGQPVV